MDRVTKQKVVLRCQRDDETIEVEVPNAYMYKGLAIHKPIGGKRGWTLTHLASSISQTSGFSLKVSEIEGALVSIASLQDWEQDFDTVVIAWSKDEALRQRVAKAFGELHRDGVTVTQEKDEA